MKKKYTITVLKQCALLLTVFSVTVSCKPERVQLSQAESKLVQDSVSRMAANIAADISKNGPRAWLNYFEDTPDFFMADDGQLVFKDYPSAKIVILNTVVKNIRYINLRWEHLRVDPLESNLASMGAGFHEDQVDSNGKKLAIDGYFTGTAHYNGQSWKLKNAHWSVKAPDTTNH